MAKKELAKSIKKLYELQNEIEPIAIEDSTNFEEIITPKQNPGITLAIRNKVAYTIARGNDIIKVDPASEHTTSVVGKISKPDVRVGKRATYKLME